MHCFQKSLEIKQSTEWHKPCNSINRRHMNNVNRKSAHHRQSKQVFAVICKFQTDAFPVRVRQVQFEQHKVPRSLSLATPPKRQRSIKQNGQVNLNRIGVDCNVASVLGKCLSGASLGS